MFVVVGEEPLQCPVRGEGEDLAACPQEDRVVVEITTQREELAVGGDDLDGVDADRRPEIVLVDLVVVIIVIVEVIVVVIGIRVVRFSVDQLDVFVGLVFVFGTGGGEDLCLGHRHQVSVDLGAGDHLVDGIDHVVPAFVDECSDAPPQFFTVTALEVAGAGGDGTEDGVAVEELGDRGQFADLADDPDDLEYVLEFGDDLGCGVFRGKLGNGDQVKGFVLGRFEFVRLESDNGVPRGVFHQIVVVARTDEGHQFCHGREAVQILVETEECLPLIVTLTPAWGPQGERVALGDSEFDWDDVSGHGHRA